MCVNQIAMVPAVVNLVASKGKDTYSGFISELTCFKCRNVPANEKDIDVGEIWKKRPPKSSRSKSPQNAFKKWRKSNSLKAIDLQSLNVPERKPEDDMSLLKFLAINALDLSAPASDVLLKSRSSGWFQLSGHPDSLAPAGPGTVWKKRANPNDETERMVYEEISKDPQLSNIIPKYYREVDYQNEKFIELQDLLHGFQDPYVIDIKMGTRTFLESEVKNTKARGDLYQKMIAIDPNAPSQEEHEERAVTKLRYMQFRELQSSSCSLGFRIEAMKCRGSPPVTDLKKVKSMEEVQHTLELFLNGRNDVKQRLIKRISEIRSKIDQSEFFKRREVVGSSLFVIYDDYKIGVWLIDFAKTNRLPDGLTVDHRTAWQQGNHEEGLLYGMDKLITIMENLNSISKSTVFQHIPTIKVES
ncbi:hypothetical protein WA026_017716 [Henosepilachna vigintioctopunctata]|uniref:Kinase n=1 Tax=Henosepilachna vigintioctopunctata TaxID=420089 RepID=A0AAW1U8W8_9CUCU